MESKHIETHFYPDLVKLILDYINPILTENIISEIPDKYIGNITVKITKLITNKTKLKLIKKVIINIYVIPPTLINLTELNCGCTKVSIIPSNLINLTELHCYDTKVSVIQLN